MRRTARTAVAFAMILVLTLGFAANAAAEEAALSPERVTAAVENLVKRYYDFDSDNYKSYFSNLEPLVTPDEFEYLKRGAPGLMWSTLTADNAYDIAISTSYYAHFKRIVSMEPENGGDDYRGGVNVVVEFEQPQDPEAGDGIELMREKLFVELDSDYRASIFSVSTEAEVQDTYSVSTIPVTGPADPLPNAGETTGEVTPQQSVTSGVAPQTSSVDPLTIAAIALALLVAAVGAVWVIRRRKPTVPAPSVRPTPTPTPTTIDTTEPTTATVTAAQTAPPESSAPEPRGGAYCAGCGKQLKPGDRFCRTCGAQVTR